MSDASASRRLWLRDLPFAARLTLAVFLLSVGIGYLSALVQLHFQHATPGALLPTAQNAIDIFHGPTSQPESRLVSLILADESMPFNGTGEMSRAFTTRSEDWKKAVKKRPEAQVRKERETERDAVVAWVRGGADKKDYEDDRFVLPPELAGRPLTAAYVVEDSQPCAVKVKSILADRCASCHSPGAGRDANAEQFPLDTYEHLKPFVTVKASGAMSLTKLAQSTHVHLLGFAVLYGMTGLILAFSSYPWAIRVLIAPLPLAAQVVDIGFWWLARLDAPWGPTFATCIVYSGQVVALGVFLHIVLGLWDLFGKAGKLVLVLLFAAAAAGGYVAWSKVIDPYMRSEGQQPAAEAPQ
jgi:hypothetical protein